MEKRKHNNSDKVAREEEFFDRSADAVRLTSEWLEQMVSYESPAGWAKVYSPALPDDIVTLLGDVKGKKVLVYGCGYDVAPIWFARHGAQVDAIDISPKSIDIERAIAERLKLDIKAFVANAHDTLLPDSSYDILYGNAILHHLDAEKAAQEIYRLLRPGGVAVFRDVQAGNIALRCFRKLTPFWRTLDEHPLTTQSDFKIFKRTFATVRVSIYTLTALPYIFVLRLINAAMKRRITARWRLTSNVHLCTLCDKIDRLLFHIFPFLKSQAWLCLIELKKSPTKQKKDSFQ